jgi:hypothetical protein
MLNIYENEDDEGTDLHDFLTKEDLCIMSKHNSDEDQLFCLIFQPKYEIRPTTHRVLEKLNEYVNVDMMKFSADVSEDGDFFADSWNKKSNVFHDICGKSAEKSKKSPKKSKK